MKISIGRTTHFFFFLTLVFFFLQVSVLYSYLPIILAAITLIIAFFTYKIKIKTNEELFTWVFLFNIPVLVIPLIGLFSSFVADTRYDYNQLNFLGRVSNLILLNTFILFLHYIFSREEQLYKPIKFYWFGTALLALTGIWQLLSFYNLVSFPFETRDYLHSVSGLQNVAGRLTGIAREPSYFVPIIVDLTILSVLFLYHKIKYLVFSLLISITCLYFSFSPTGYIVLSLSIAGAFFSMILHKKTFIYVMIIFPILFIILIYFEHSDAGYYFLERLKSSGTGGRYEMITLPFYLISDSNLFTALFGYGIKSYSIIGTSINLSSGYTVAVTSNNIFADVLWESGILGFFSLSLFFIYIYYKIVKSKFSYLQKYIAFFIFFDLLSSSIFRADYASLRFFMLIYIIYVLTYVDFRVKTT